VRKVFFIFFCIQTLIYGELFLDKTELNSLPEGLDIAQWNQPEEEIEGQEQEELVFFCYYSILNKKRKENNYKMIPLQCMRIKVR